MKSGICWSSREDLIRSGIVLGFVFGFVHGFLGLGSGEWDSKNSDLEK